MAQKIDIREEVYGGSIKKKKQKKIKYNKEVKTEYFNLNDLVLLKDLTLYLEKLIKQWHRLFIIDNFARDYIASYMLKTLNEKLALNTHYSDHLCIFCPWEKYLRRVDEKPLVVIYNLYIKKKKEWDGIVICKIYI